MNHFDSGGPERFSILIYLIDDIINDIFSFYLVISHLLSLQWRYMGFKVSQITAHSIVYSTNWAGYQQKYYQSSALLVLCMLNALPMSPGYLLTHSLTSMRFRSWWRYQTETFSALLALCVGNSPVQRWIPLTKASDAELWCFLWSASE